MAYGHGVHAILFWCQPYKMCACMHACMSVCIHNYVCDELMYMAFQDHVMWPHPQKHPVARAVAPATVGNGGCVYLPSFLL